MFGVSITLLETELMLELGLLRLGLGLGRNGSSDFRSGGRCSAGGKCPVLGDERADRDDGQCTVQKQQQQQQQWQRRRIGGG